MEIYTDMGHHQYEDEKMTTPQCAATMIMLVFVVLFAAWHAVLGVFRK